MGKLSSSHKHKQETIDVIRKFTSIPKISTYVSQTRRHQGKSFSNFTNNKHKHKHKQKQETNNVISKFTSLPEISTCVSQTRRHQHKHKHKQETNNVISKFTSLPKISTCKIHEPTKGINMRKPNKKTPSKKFFKFVNIEFSGKLS
ncbi:hypothetical protein YC2023_085153 [Brassica napus]